MIARVPFDPATTWKKLVRLRVCVGWADRFFRTSLFSEAGRGGHFVLVNKKTDKAGDARVGTMVDYLGLLPTPRRTCTGSTSGAGEVAKDRKSAVEMVRQLERFDALRDRQVD